MHTSPAATPSSTCCTSCERSETRRSWNDSRPLSRERSLLIGDGDRAEDLQKALAAASDKFLAVARDLSSRRRAQAVVLARSVETLLADLAMETLVLKPEYVSLFTDDERVTAARRLEEVGARTVTAARS